MPLITTFRNFEALDDCHKQIQQYLDELTLLTNHIADGGVVGFADRTLAGEGAVLSLGAPRACTSDATARYRSRQQGISHAQTDVELRKRCIADSERVRAEQTTLGGRLPSVVSSRRMPLPDRRLSKKQWRWLGARPVFRNASPDVDGRRLVSAMRTCMETGAYRAFRRDAQSMRRQESHLPARGVVQSGSEENDA